MKRSRVLPPTYLFCALVAVGLTHFVFPGPRILWGWWRLLGLPLAVLGAWLSVHSDALFKRVGTEIKPFRESSKLVTYGPYRFSRHPMYLGFTFLLLGLSVLAGTLVPLVVTVVGFCAFNFRFAVPEERHMEEQFGDDYRAYRSRVRRWL
jgi:protein-S-isoprenylcysteine O-methyltransferase Ste14